MNKHICVGDHVDYDGVRCVVFGCHDSYVELVVIEKPKWDYAPEIGCYFTANKDDKFMRII